MKSEFTHWANLETARDDSSMKLNFLRFWIGAARSNLSTMFFYIYAISSIKYRYFLCYYVSNAYLCELLYMTAANEL